ncbi:MAG TPA: TolC family protein, partial [Polyangiaceae bacterium]
MHTIPRVVAVAALLATSTVSLPALSAPGASAAPPTCPALADAVSREHPALRAAAARARAATERSGAERSLPPPSVSFEIWDFPIGAPSRADEEGMYMLGVGQEFPGGGRSDRARAEKEEARAESAMGTDVARIVRADVARACVAWSVAETVRARLVEYRRQLEQVRDAALVGYRGSAGRLGDVARAEAEIAGAERR